MAKKRKPAPKFRAHVRGAGEDSPTLQLESMIDRSSLAVVTGALGEICELKADHINENWQDRALARRWTKAGKMLGRLTVALRKLNTPGIS